MDVQIQSVEWMDVQMQSVEWMAVQMQSVEWMSKYRVQSRFNKSETSSLTFHSNDFWYDFI